MATDKKSLQLIIDDYDAALNNGVPDDSITPDIDNDLRSNALITIAHYGVLKYNIKNSGTASSAGDLILNNDFDAATQIDIFKVNAHNDDISDTLDLIDSGVVIGIKDFEGNYGEFTVTSKTDNSTYFSFDVTANSNNPSYTAQGLEGYMAFNGGAGGGGGTNTNIIKDNLTQTSNRQQDLGGNTQEWFNGKHRYAQSVVVSQSVDSGNTGTTLTIDLSEGNYFIATATDNFTLEFTNAPAGTRDVVNGSIKITQDGTGSRVLTKGTDVISQGGVTPLLSITAGAVDIVHYEYRQDIDKLLISVTNDWK